MNPIDVRELAEHPGSSKRVHLREAVPGLALQLAEVPPDAPIEGELLLENVVEGIFVSGEVEGRMVLQCARCLSSFDRDFSVEVGDLFSTEADPVDEDIYPIEDAGSLDPEPMVRDAVLLSMPFSPLCRPDCKGLSSDAGATATSGRAHAATLPQTRGGRGSSTCSTARTRRETTWRFRRGDRARPAATSARRTGRAPRRRTRNAPSATSRSSRTACAATAAITPAGRPSRSSSRWRGRPA